jgi:5'-3' exonuclease
VRLLAVDGSSLAHRAWHSTRGDAVGPDLDVVLAAIGSMLASTWRYGPYDVALIALDHPENRRRDLFPSYKAQRPATDPDLRAVLAALPARVEEEMARASIPGLSLGVVIDGHVDTVLSRGKVVIDDNEYHGAKGDGVFLKRGLSQYLI